MSTDYDCWHEGHDDVTVDQVIAVLQANVALAKRIIRLAVPRLAAMERPEAVRNALRNAIMTASDRIPPDRRAALHLLVREYLG